MLGFSGWLQVQLGGPWGTLWGAEPAPRSRTESGLVLLGGCLERLGFGTDTRLSLGGAGSCWVPEGRIRWCVFPERQNTNCLRSCWSFVPAQTPGLARGDILLHCGDSQIGIGMGLGWAELSLTTVKLVAQFCAVLGPAGLSP